MNYVLKNSRVFSVDLGEFSHRDLYITDGRISDRVGPEALTMDLSGKFIYPGFVDSHAHLIGTGLEKMAVDLRNCRSMEDLRSRLQIESHLVRARGWDQETLGFLPERRILDRITSQPAILIRRCGHVATVNSAAIDRFSLETLDGLDETDIENGVIKERALERLNSIVKLTPEEVEEAIRIGSTEFLKYGVTCVHSDDFHGLKLETLVESLSRISNIRVFEKIAVENSDQLSMLDIAKDGETSFFKVIAAKIYMDGSLGARTAAMKEPYSDSPRETGVLYMDCETLKRIVERADRKAFQLCVHVIGDKSLEEALKAFHGSRAHELKHRLIHVQIASPEQIRRIADLGLTASIQPVFFDSDAHIAPDRFGEERMRDAYPFKQMRDVGIRMALSTDSPVESPSILPNLVSADRFFQRRDALKMYTKAGYCLANMEERGSLLPGEEADLFVSSVNLLDGVGEAESEITFVDGKIVYRTESR
ncbi:MAG TPA: amidohydrolase [Mesotoga infera]|nr:amidohydrolase [Mesotoga infera]